MLLTVENCVWSIGGMILTGKNLVWSIGGMVVTGENINIERVTCPSATTINHKYSLDWPGIELGTPR
jgi:hypothetical protein